MKITIQSIHFDAADRLLEFIQTKFDKLAQLYASIIDVQVFLKLEKNNEQGNKIVEVKVLVPAQTLVASSQNKTFEEAVDSCLEQIKRQVVKYKEKTQADAKAGIPVPAGFEADETVEATDAEAGE